MKSPYSRPTILPMLRRFVVLCLLFSPLAGCGTRTGTPDIIILQTGRIFGNVYPLETKSIAPLQYYPYVAGYVKQVREEAEKNGSQVLLIDSGDSLGGSFASHATHSANMVAFFNTLHYDAILLGNLDASIDPSVLSQLRMPVLAPFLTADGKSPLPMASPAITLSKGPFAVRLLSNFYGDTAPSGFPQRFPMWFGPERLRVKPVRDYSAFLQSAAPSGQIPLTLFHWMKFEPTSEAPAFVHELRKNGVDAILAHRIYNSGIRDTWERQNLGHWPLPVSENILRQNGGFSIARLDLVRKGAAWVPSGPPTLVQMTANTAPADPEIITEINRLAPTLKSADENLATLDKTLTEARLLPSYMKLLVLRFQADAVLFSTASIRSEIPAGTVTANKLYAALPWSNPLAVLHITPAQLARSAAMTGHAVLQKKNPPAETRLLTSLFFARLLQDRLGLPDSALEIIPGSHEFENAKAMVKARPSSLADASIPEGWSYATAP